MNTIALSEWSDQHFPVDAGLETGLRQYLEDAWANRPLLYELNDEEEEEPGPAVQRFLDFKPGYVKARNYVGFIQYNDIRITIEPKVFEDRLLSFESKVGHLLKWLSYSRRIHFPFLESSFDHNTQQEDWLEAFIFLFANYTQEILSTSPHMAYNEITEETAFVKGRLAMNEYVHQNLAKGRHQKVYCTYELFLYDNLFNRIVKHTCRYLLQVTTSHTNTEILENIIFLLDEVENSFCSATDCDRVQVNRMYPEIEHINNLCRLFLANQSYASSYTATNNICILLPMEVIFEEFVFGFIEKHFPDLKAKRQAKDMFLAKIGPDFTTNVFRMKHDILIPDKIIIDTKYKVRYRGFDKKAGVSQTDLYQMTSYAWRRGIKNALLLFPETVNGDNSLLQLAITNKENIEVAIHITAASINIVEENLKFEEKIYRQLENLKLF